MRLGPLELALIVLIILLLFGGKRLKDLAKSMGESIKEFKQGMAEKDDVKSEKKE